MGPWIALLAGIYALVNPSKAQGYAIQVTNSVKKVGVKVGTEIFGPMMPASFWNAEKVMRVAKSHIAKFGLNCSPTMIAAMVKIESNFKPKAYRFEAHLNDASYGLMQTMLKTAQWMHDIGYKGYPYPSGEDLYVGECSLYFGMAYVDYLTKYKKKFRDEQWVVESYNGGPGNSNSGTRNHLRKYYEAKTEIA